MQVSTKQIYCLCTNSSFTDGVLAIHIFTVILWAHTITTLKTPQVNNDSINNITLYQVYKYKRQYVLSYMHVLMKQYHAFQPLYIKRNKNMKQIFPLVNHWLLQPSNGIFGEKFLNVVTKTMMVFQ